MFWFSSVAASSTELFRKTPAGLEVRVRLLPNGFRDRIEGVRFLPNGERVINVRVRAVPEKGKANASLLKLLSKQWGLPKSSIRIIAGGKDRMKLVLLADAGEEDRIRIEALHQFCPGNMT